MEFITYMRDFNIVTVLARVFLACLAGGILGAERGKHGRVAKSIRQIAKVAAAREGMKISIDII